MVHLENAVIAWIIDNKKINKKKTMHGAKKSNLTDRSFMRANIEFHWTTKNLKCNENNWNSKFTYDEKIRI